MWLVRVKLEYYGNNKNKTALDFDFCSEDVPSLIRASPFTANEDIIR